MSSRRKPSWSAEEDATLLAMVNEGATYPKIGQRLGRSKDAVGSRAKVLGIQVARERPGFPQVRQCIHCERDFSATHPKNTRCEDCARRSPSGSRVKRIQCAETTPRECLKCEREFPSHGPGNRICRRCQQTQDWRDGEVVAV